ncbi:hypothetical protein [Bifidobacterium lemurum]|nr:hypothetical protein [Bifidobacterium lemurum]
MTLYTLTALACVVWIWQSVRESMQDGTLASAPTIIFLVCIGIAAIYCAGNALMLWWRQDDNEEAGTGKADETSVGAHSDVRAGDDAETGLDTDGKTKTNIETDKTEIETASDGEVSAGNEPDDSAELHA